MASSNTSAIRLVLAAAFLGTAAASVVATLPGGSLVHDDSAADLAPILEGGEAAEAGSLAAGVEPGRNLLDPEAGAGVHGVRARSEVSSDLDVAEGEQVDSAFNEFYVKHHRSYQHGTAEYAMRKALFKQRLAAVHAHNKKEGRLWEAAPSRFSDQTEAERKAVRGYRRKASRERSGGSVFQHSEPPKELPTEKSWTHLAAASNIRDQGSCGSCWAITTTSLLEAHYEIYMAKDGKTRTFSPQQTLECTPNPQDCGGTGGCEGATVELGMGYVLKSGIASEEEVPYTGEDGTCSASGGSAGTASNDPGSGDDGEVLTRKRHSGGESFGLVGYHTVQPNVDYPLAEAVATYGPVAISASAGSWFEYSNGVFDGCDKDAVVDHAITLYGYGNEGPTTRYWLIKNSWGADWGEKGYIRLLRPNKKHCGTDDDPAQGVGCKGGPSSVPVCGMCGMFLDSVVPYFNGSPGHGGASPSYPASDQSEDSSLTESNVEDKAERVISDSGASLMRMEAKRN